MLTPRVSKAWSRNSQMTEPSRLESSSQQLSRLDSRPTANPFLVCTSVTALARSRLGVTHNSATFEHLSQSTSAIRGACRERFIPAVPSLHADPDPYRGLPRLPPWPYSRSSRVVSLDFRFIPLCSTYRHCFPRSHSHTGASGSSVRVVESGTLR